MKVLRENGKIIVFLFNENVDVNNIKELNDKMRKIFIKLIKRYQLDFFGYNEVIVYHNKNYGLVLEIEKICDLEYMHGTIDLKIIVYKNCTMYLEFDDYCFSNKPKNLIYKNNKYYINIDDIIDITRYIEYGRVIIKKNY